MKIYKIFKTGWKNLKSGVFFSNSSSARGKSHIKTYLSKISSCDTDSKVADIVFVHGLDGSAVDTWTNSNGFYWPKELGKELNDVDIWSLGYNASPTGQTLPLPHLAANIVTYLQNCKVGVYPLIFVCHSLGGLLVKEILRNCSDRQDEGHSIFNKTKGIIFLATPHTGSLWASGLKKIPLIISSPLFKALEWNDLHLYNLNLWFRDNFKGEVAVYFETFPIAGISVVVDLNSSDPGMPKVRPVPVEADHIAICKPADTNELVYMDSKRLIEQVLFNKTIEADVLPKVVLHSICEASLLSYQKELFLLDSTRWISRSISKQIQSSICNQRKSLQFLVGQSGFGKSTLAFQGLKEHINAGGYGLWLPASVVHESNTLQNAIVKIITSLDLTLDLDFVYSLFEYFSSTNKLLIVVDDINQDKDSMKIARKLISWAALIKGEEREEVLATNIIICPIWPNLWNGIEIVTKGQQWIDTIFIEAFDSLEGTEVLLLSDDKITSKFEAETMVTKLGNDPILIALFSSMHKEIQNDSLDILAEDVIDKFIDHCILKVVSNEQYFLVNEYQQVLLDLSMFMIKNKNIHPTWTEIKEWLAQSDKSIDLIRILIRTEFICRLNNQDKFVFRHDRIQNTILVKAMVQLFKMNQGVDDILAEPYYSDLIAKALLKSTDIEIIEKLKKVNILALVEALKIFGTVKKDLESIIVKEIYNWIKEQKDMPDSLFDSICLSLIETDSPSVLEITQEFPSLPLILLARLRNGCAVSGVKYCCMNQSGFVPSIGDKLRDRIIEYAKQRYQDELIRQLKILFKDINVSDDIREGVLSFAGFMSSAELSEFILPYWQSAVDKQRLLPEAIWAGIRCSGANPEGVLNELLDFWATLPEKVEKGRSPRNEVAEVLRLSFKYGVDEKILDYLCKKQRQVANLEWGIAYMLELVDSPKVMEVLVKTAADIQRKMEATKGFSPWVISLTDRWNGRTGKSHRLSDPSFTLLYRMWTTTTDKHIQGVAFRLWSTRAEKDDIGILRNISSDSVIYNQAIRKRAQLGDVSVISDFVTLFKKDYHWGNVAYHIWSPEIMDVVKQHILSFEVNIPKNFSGGNLNPHYEVAELITKIPIQDGETLLVDYWYILGYSPRFVQSALYLGTQKSLELAAWSVAKCPVEVDLFKYIGDSFGFLSKRSKYLTQTKLNSLIPYLDRLSESDLRGIMEECERLGIPEWSKKNVVNLSDKCRRRYNPSDNDLMVDLDEMANDKYGVWRVSYWLEDFNKRNDSYERALRVIDNWLENSMRGYANFKIVAAVLKSVGRRNDINILYKHQSQNIATRVLCEIIEDTKFAIWKRTLG